MFFFLHTRRTQGKGCRAPSRAQQQQQSLPAGTGSSAPSDEVSARLQHGALLLLVSEAFRDGGCCGDRRLSTRSVAKTAFILHQILLFRVFLKTNTAAGGGGGTFLHNTCILLYIFLLLLQTNTFIYLLYVHLIAIFHIKRHKRSFKMQPIRAKSFLLVSKNNTICQAK